MTLPVTNCSAGSSTAFSKARRWAILALEQLRIPFPLLELIVLGLEAIDLVEGIGIGSCALDQMPPFDHRNRHCFEQRRGEIDEALAQVVDPL